MSKSAAISAGSRPLGTRWVASAAVVALIAVTVGVMGVIYERAATRTLTRETETRILLVARDLAHLGAEAILDDFPELALHPALREIGQEQPELDLLVVTDREGRIVGHREAIELGESFELPSGLEVVERENLHRGETLFQNSKLTVVSVPIRRGEDLELGRVVIGVKRSYLHQRVAAARKAQLAVLVVLGLLGAGSALLLLTRMLRPIEALREGLERIGEGDLETPVEVAGTSELSLLATALNETASSLKSAREALVEKERLDHEMRLARSIQQGLLPATELRAGPFRIRGHQDPALEVGGDYYDVFPLPGGRVGLVMADVAGKGLGGCLSTSMLAAFLRAYRDQYTVPAELLQTLDQQLRSTLPRASFITMFYGILEPGSGIVRFASAGHSPTAIYRGGRAIVEWFPLRGTPLAASRNPAFVPRFQQAEIHLAPGDTLVQYTDGINEAWDPERDEQFGYERLRNLIQGCGHLDADAMVREMCSAVESWNGVHGRRDDETLLVVSHEGERARQRGRGTESLTSLVALARQHGRRLALPVDLRSLRSLNHWLATCPPVGQLDKVTFSLLRTGLYEICANIAEHGHRHTTDGEIEILWLPGPDPDSLATLEELARCIREGQILVVDHGIAFDLSQAAPEFSEQPPTRGRGLGLRLIHATMQDIRYEANTPAGNITAVRFDPLRHRLPQEVAP